MQVDATFAELAAAPLQLRISRSSPGRYALHDFTKNVYDVHAYGADGRELRLDRPDADGWNVPAHAGTVTVKYKVYGDRVDGTYLAIDTSHAHINMPAAIMWARGLDDRPATLTFDPPGGLPWHIATQLHPGATANEFTAPNLQYLIDSPVEFAPLAVETFMVGSQTFRFVYLPIESVQIHSFGRLSGLLGVGEGVQEERHISGGATGGIKRIASIRRLADLPYPGDVMGVVVCHLRGLLLAHPSNPLRLAR